MFDFNCQYNAMFILKKLEKQFRLPLEQVAKTNSVALRVTMLAAKTFVSLLTKN